MTSMSPFGVRDNRVVASLHKLPIRHDERVQVVSSQIFLAVAQIEFNGHSTLRREPFPWIGQTQSLEPPLLFRAREGRSWFSRRTFGCFRWLSTLAYHEVVVPAARRVVFGQRGGHVRGDVSELRIP